MKINVLHSTEGAAQARGLTQDRDLFNVSVTVIRFDGQTFVDIPSFGYTGHLAELSTKTNNNVV